MTMTKSPTATTGLSAVAPARRWPTVPASVFNVMSLISTGNARHAEHPRRRKRRSHKIPQRRSSGKKCHVPRMPKKNAELATPSGLFLLQSTVPSEVRKGNARRAKATTHNQHLDMSPLYFCKSSIRNADYDDRPIYRDADAEGRPHQHPSMELRWARDKGE